jgi:transcriptional activator for dhaKLM operon
MQPAASLPNLDRLKAAWEHFTTTGHLPAEGEMNSLVAASWQRCAPRLNPNGQPLSASISPELLPSMQGQRGSLRTIARPIMEDIHQFIEGVGAVLLLLDTAHCTLEILGDSDLLTHVQRLGLRTGVFLDESRVGTHAWTIALIERTPAQVIGPEHFLSCFHDLSSVAAPIYDLEGNPVGTIGLIEWATQHDPKVLGIMVAAARAIENQLQAQLFVREANTHATELNTTLNAISEGVLAWTAQGIIMHLNQQAGQLLDLTPSAVVGRPLSEYLTLPEGLARAVANGEELSDVETSLGAFGGTPRECLVSLRVIRDGDDQAITYIATLRRIEQVRQLVTRLVGAQARLTLDDMVGHGVAARRLRRQALSAAEAKACVLLAGESGTGKNVLARAIHNSGRRAGGPFLAINCRAIPSELVLGEFLGFEAGAFNSGPTTGQPSKFELAHGGTLFLEEIEALPLEMQAALLRVIEVEDVIRLGGTHVIPVDTRIIASTAVPLETRVAEGSFRGDLLLRLSSFVINTVPLRERQEDIPLLVERLLEKLSVQIGQTLAIAPASLAALRVYPWPNNIRELESVMERAVVACEGQPIQPEHLPAAVRQPRALAKGKRTTEPVHTLMEAEQNAILAAGRAARGNLSQAAQFLGINRTTLWRKMRALGITTEDFR